MKTRHSEYSFALK